MEVYNVLWSKKYTNLIYLIYLYDNKQMLKYKAKKCATRYCDFCRTEQKCVGYDVACYKTTSFGTHRYMYYVCDASMPYIKSFKDVYLLTRFIFGNQLCEDVYMIIFNLYMQLLEIEIPICKKQKLDYVNIDLSKKNIKELKEIIEMRSLKMPHLKHNKRHMYTNVIEQDIHRKRELWIIPL